MIFFVLIFWPLMSVPFFIGGYRLVKLVRQRNVASFTFQYKLLTFIYLAIPLSVTTYFNYEISTMNSHSDIKKGSLRWYMTMDDPTINNFPILNPIEKPIYNQIGEAGPAYGIGWQVTYTSSKDFGSLQKSIAKYLSSEGYIFNNYDEHGNTIEYSAQKKEKGLILILIKKMDETEVDASIYK